jgi:hypothetical protein
MCSAYILVNPQINRTGIRWNHHERRRSTHEKTTRHSGCISVIVTDRVLNCDSLVFEELASLFCFHASKPYAYMFSTKSPRRSKKQENLLVPLKSTATIYCLVCGKRSAGRQSEKLLILFRGGLDTKTK